MLSAKDLIHGVESDSEFVSSALARDNPGSDEPEKPVVSHLSGVPVAPTPIDAQPGEGVPATRLGSPGLASIYSQHQPSESPVTHDLIPTGGRLHARASTVFAEARGTLHLASRLGSAEQSNTSIMFGKDLIMKVFRRVQPGENPDVEIGRFLTEVAHFSRIAPFLGELTVTPEGESKTTVGMLQGLVANQGDGWQWFLDQLAAYFASTAELPEPPNSSSPTFDADREIPPQALRYAGTSLEAAALLGRRTAEMHLALATPTNDPSFSAEPLTAADLAADARRIDAQISSTLEALKIKLSSLKDLIADDAGLLLSRRINLFARAHAITTGNAAGQRIRIHGDYHLGQTLRTEDDDFVLLDFEGEPARLLSERRQKQSPLKDVAGMIRSFSYVTYASRDNYFKALAEPPTATVSERITAWAVLWQNAASSEFLRAYRETIASNPTLLPNPQQAQSLLAAYLLEKALYELSYELNNRPTWLRIPLTGILAL